MFMLFIDIIILVVKKSEELERKEVKKNVGSQLIV